MEKKFVMLEHKADIKFEINARSFEEIFNNAALAFSNYVSSGLRINEEIEKVVKIKADNPETLLYNFLDELIYLMDAKNFVVSKAKVEIKNLNITALLTGDSVKKYNLNHVKAATYAEMFIKKSKNNFLAQFVLDV